MATIRQNVSRSDMTRVDMSRPFGGEVRRAPGALLGAWCLKLVGVGGLAKPKGIAKKPLA